jgi:cellulose synthase (UDP-forming)
MMPWPNLWRRAAVRLGLQHPDDPRQLRYLLLSLLFVTPAPGWVAWWRDASRYFPHIDFSRPRIADPLRVVLQLFWLAVVRSPRERMPLRATRLFRIWRSRLRVVRGVIRQIWTAARGRLSVGSPMLFDRDRGREMLERLSGESRWDSRAVRWACYGLALLLGLVCITTPFDEWSQGLFTLVLLLIALWVRRLPGPVPNLILMVFSMGVSTRYIWWRCTSTINNDSWPNLITGLVLLGAELYAWFVLLLGFFQSSWMLRRQVVPLPHDTAQWPHVDVFIPIYNEPLHVLKPTVFAALTIDWPREKLHVHILDDGHRDEIRRFAAQVGVNYIARIEHRYAKAGNINHALGLTHAAFVAIFDCDHIPTRSFLQATMGGFLRDEMLALVQTPHHFFSADPFERNLDTRDKVPNEGQLFYGRIQDGNDLWNATFFCGSCAVLRRDALERVGGVAVETVTEDAHTSLKMHRLGYRSAYINQVQAAGLATESLSAHIGQRIRWARGMSQIFRSDNPLLGDGLSFGQRLCYLNSMLHFLYGIPRLVFLTAPLAFLLFHAYTIYAPALGLVLYVLPHMIFSVLSNSRLHGAYRQSFWGEIYETVLAWYITIPTTVALLFPGLGKFNVTAKGGVVEHSHIDWDITRPYLALLALNAFGFGLGLWRLLSGPSYEIGTVVVNLFWVLYNSLLLGVAIGVAREARQVRVSHRVYARLPLTLHLPDGKAYPCHTVDYSAGGMAIELPPGLTVNLLPDTALTVSLRRGYRSFALPCRLVLSRRQRVSVRFVGLSLEQEKELVQCTFSRADAWLSAQRHRQEAAPIKSFGEIWTLGARNLWRLLMQLFIPLRLRGGRIVSLLRWLTGLLPRYPQFKRETP